MKATDLKTIIDAEEGITNGYTMTVYVFMSTDPDTVELEPPVCLTTGVIIVLMDLYGIPFRFSQGSDLWTYTGSVLIYGTSLAHIDTAIAELKRIGEDNTNKEQIQFFHPASKGEIDESLYVAVMTVEWTKIVARA